MDKLRPAPQSSLPSGVWVLGFVSMLMDISSEMIHSLLPMFLVGTFGVSMMGLGLIEGVAESTALITKVFSGALSDYLGKRKLLAVLGYAMGAFTKPVFALASTVGVVVAARFIDRVGKGIRGAPRDALLADLTPPSIRGAAFGLRESLDTLGAFIGPLLATVLMLASANDFRMVFWVAVVPGGLAVLLLLFGIKEPPQVRRPAAQNPLRREAIRQLGKAYWQVVVIGMVFTLARFSEAFLVMQARQIGIEVSWVPLVMVAMSGAYAASAYPLGKLSDTVGREKLLALGLLVLIVSDLVIATTHHWAGLLIGVLLWGVHMGGTQGLLAAMVADTAPAELRGTAYGFFSLMSGGGMLASSVLAGWLWDHFGPVFTFYAGAGFAAATLVLLLWRRWRH